MEDYQKKEESQQEKIKVIPTAAEQVVLEDYQTSEFSMKLPTGWVVNSGGDGMAFSLCAYDPQNPVNQVFVLLKAMPLMHDANSKSYLNNPSKCMAEIIILWQTHRRWRSPQKISIRFSQAMHRLWRKMNHLIMDIHFQGSMILL